MLISGLLFTFTFLCWQYHLERVQTDAHSYNPIFTPPPLLKLSIWRRANGRFAAMMVIAFSNWSSFLAWIFWVQLFYQNYKHYTPLQTSLRLLPMFVSGILCNIIAGLFASRIPLVWITGVGTLATTSACLIFALMPPTFSYWAFAFPAIFMSAMGADLISSAGTNFIAKFALPHEQSVAGALFMTMTQLGTTVGVVVSTTVFKGVARRVLPEGKDPILMYRAAQWTAFGFGVVGKSFFSLFLFFFGNCFLCSDCR